VPDDLPPPLTPLEPGPRPSTALAPIQKEVVALRTFYVDPDTGQPLRPIRDQDLVDWRTTTGVWHVVRKEKYGNRPGDKSIGFVILWHSYKSLVQLLGLLALVGILALANRCGVELPFVGGHH